MIRAATETDYPALRHIWQESVAATHTFLDAAFFEHIRSRLVGYFAHVYLVVYEEGDKIKGFAGVADGKLEMLFVGERGKGIGTKLLDYAVENLRVTQLDVNEQNTAAVAFYNRFGFRRVGRSATDSEGRPYPILHMELDKSK